MYQEKYRKLKDEIQRGVRQASWSYIEDIITPAQNSNENGDIEKLFWTYIKHKNSYS